MNGLARFIEFNHLSFLK